MPLPVRILVVEDQKAIADAIEYNLTQVGYDVEVMADGAQAAEQDLNAYDLAVLDLMLPGMPGEEVCRHWRTRSVVPVLMLTARTDVAERVLGLEVGADDYLGKPFSMPELLARVRAILRRRDMDREDTQPLAALDVGGLHLDLIEHVALVDGRNVALTPLEFRLLALLARRPGHTYTRHEITQHLWRRPYRSSDRACDTHIKNIRQKIELDPSRPRLLVSVRGIGYLLREP